MLIKMRESKGFTLVELMIVVAIIGILAAVAIPYYQRYVQKAKMQKYVFPTEHIWQTNISTHYAINETFPNDIPGIADGDTSYLTGYTWDKDTKELSLTVQAGPNDELKAFDGERLVSYASVVDNAGSLTLKWKFVDTGIAKTIGMGQMPPS